MAMLTDTPARKPNLNLLLDWQAAAETLSVLKLIGDVPAILILVWVLQHFAVYSLSLFLSYILNICH